MNWGMARDIWWLIGLMVGALCFAARAGWKSRQLISRLDRLEKRDAEQQEDISALLGGMFAVLDGLKQQGCNGEVTLAYGRLKEYVVTKR